MYPKEGLETTELQHTELLNRDVKMQRGVKSVYPGNQVGAV